MSNHVVGRTDELPNHLIVDSQGTEIFSEERPRVCILFGGLLIMFN